MSSKLEKAPLGLRPVAYQYPGGRTVCVGCAPRSQFAAGHASRTWYKWPKGAVCARCKRDR